MSDQTLGLLIVLGFLTIVWWWEVLRVVVPRALATARRIPRSLSKRRREQKALEVAVAQGACPHTRLHQHVRLDDLPALFAFKEVDFLMEFTCKDCGVCRGRIRGPVRLEYTDRKRLVVENPETP